MGFIKRFISSVTIKQWLIVTLVICVIIGFWWLPLFYVSAPILLVLFLSDNALSKQVQDENKPVNFRGGVVPEKESRFDEHEEFYNHDKN